MMNKNITLGFSGATHRLRIGLSLYTSASPLFSSHKGRSNTARKFQQFVSIFVHRFLLYSAQRNIGYLATYRIKRSRLERNALVQNGHHLSLIIMNRSTKLPDAKGDDYVYHLTDVVCELLRSQSDDPEAFDLRMGTREEPFVYESPAHRVDYVGFPTPRAAPPTTPLKLSRVKRVTPLRCSKSASAATSTTRPISPLSLGEPWIPLEGAHEPHSAQERLPEQPSNMTGDALASPHNKEDASITANNMSVADQGSVHHTEVRSFEEEFEELAKSIVSDNVPLSIACLLTHASHSL
jgi:hypothetical protein